jgi:uncharacterized protein
MYILPHDLDHEFPEFSRQIHDLRDRDAQLADLCAEYDRVNQVIVDIEENDRPFQDFEFEQMKKKRLRIKDGIYAVLRSQGGGSA